MIRALRMFAIGIALCIALASPVFAAGNDEESVTLKPTHEPMPPREKPITD